MNKLFKKTQEFVFAQQTSMFSSTIILSAMMILARLFGFLRYRILTNYFEVRQLDIYFASFKIPDLIFEVLITGALSTSFIPFFIKYKNDHEKLSKNISSIINFITLILFLLIIMVTILANFILPVITPGFSKEKIDLIIYYSRIILIGQLPFLVVGNFFTGISQARKRFLIPAVAPIIYNVGIIICTILFSSKIGLEAPVLGVVIGAFLFFVIQLPVIFVSDFEYRFILERSRILWDFFRVTMPRVFTVITAQIEATVDLSLSSLISDGSYAIFYLAQHLQLLPVSVIGIAFGQASLPYLSEMYHEKQTEGLKSVIIESILNLFFFIIPIAIFFMFANTNIVKIFFGSRKFDPLTTKLTALTLAYFALSVPFHSIYYFLTRCFYAIFDTRTPFYISIFSIALNAMLSLFFILVLHLQVYSLAIAFSTAMNVSVIILLYRLHKKLNGFDYRELLFNTGKILLASLIPCVIAYKYMTIFDGLIFDTTRTINVFMLLCTTGILYFLLYLFLCWVFSVKEFGLVLKMLLKAKEYQKKIFEIYTGIE